VPEEDPTGTVIPASSCSEPALRFVSELPRQFLAARTGAIFRENVLSVPEVISFVINGVAELKRGILRKWQALHLQHVLHLGKIAGAVG
jgi:hypothetical protein